MTYENILVPEERVAIFIDGYFFSQLKNDSKNKSQKEGLNNRNYERGLSPISLRDWVESQARLVRSNFYGVVQADLSEEKSKIVKFFTFLSFSGYHVHKHVLNHVEERVSSRAYAVKMAVDLLTFGEYVDHVLLFSAERDLSYAVQALQAKGKKVSLIYNPESKIAYPGRQLLLCADRHIDYLKLLDVVPFRDDEEPHYAKLVEEDEED